MSLALSQALALPQPPFVAFVGAGGKTRALFTLARELEPPVLMTTTTHLAREQAAWAEVHQVAEGTFFPDLPTSRRVLVTGPLQEDRWTAPSEAVLAALIQRHQSLPAALLVEADGAARKPLKAPADHEPALPAEVNAVVTVAGLDALGRPATESTVHRVERFCRLAGLQPGEPVTPEALARVLAHPEGGRKGLPLGAVWRVLLVGHDVVALSWGWRVAEALWAYVSDVRVVVAAGEAEALRVEAVFVPVAGIVLAAGPSRRMGGRPKVLLPVEGEPMVRRVARTALAAGLAPVVVVVGHEAEQVAQAVEDLPVQVVLNPAWSQGQSTSVKAGLQALPAGVGAAVFLLADMPFVTPALVRALRMEHARTLAPIVAPLVEQRRGNPVLFDAATFGDLMALEGDVGGRALFTRYRTHWLPWLDETTQWDIDTPEDYRMFGA